MLWCAYVTLDAKHMVECLVFHAIWFTFSGGLAVTVTTVGRRKNAHGKEIVSMVARVWSEVGKLGSLSLLGKDWLSHWTGKGVIMTYLP
jgi:hypothetical protein